MRTCLLLINVGIALSDPGTPVTRAKEGAGLSMNKEGQPPKEKPGATLRSVNAHGDIEPFVQDTVRTSEVQVQASEHRPGSEDTVRSSEVQVPQNIVKAERDSSEVRKKRRSGGEILEAHEGVLEANLKTSNEPQDDTLSNMEQQHERQSPGVLQLLKMLGNAFINKNADSNPISNHPVHRSNHATYAPADQDMWINFAACVLAFLFLDLLALRYVALKMESRFGIPNWSMHLMFSIVASVAFSSYMFAVRGETACMSWLNGFALEILLSLDNLLVFVMIFTAWKTPHGQARYKVLMWGIAFAVLLRLALFSALQFFLNLHMAFAIILASFLIFTGTMAVFGDGDDEEEDYQNSRIITWISSILPTTPRYVEDHFIFEGKLTILFFVACSVEVTDVAFAIDSISTKVAHIPDGFTSYTSTVFAMFVLRALVTVLDSFIRSFAYVKYGIAVLMYYIGFKLIFPEYLDVSDIAFFQGICLVFAVCVILTYVYPPPQMKMAKDTEEESLMTSGNSASSTDRVPCVEDEVQDEIKKAAVQ